MNRYDIVLGKKESPPSEGDFQRDSVGRVVSNPADPFAWLGYQDPHELKRITEDFLKRREDPQAPMVRVRSTINYEGIPNRNGDLFVGEMRYKDGDIYML
jgi:hypothetical protein